jgi:hypothetical protein
MQLDVPVLPATSLTTLEAVLAEIKKLEPSLTQYFKQLGSLLPPCQHPDGGAKWAIHSITE